MKVEAVSKKNFGIKLKGKWYDVIGKARDYIDNINKDDEIDVKFDDNNKIIYIKKKESNDNSELLLRLEEIEKAIKIIDEKLSKIFEFKGGDEDFGDNTVSK